ncbi:MAG: hypothetical protein AAF611_16455 [Bacteroidota bacterium]
MTRTAITTILLSFLLFISCNTRSKIEGAWIESYTHYFDEDSIAHRGFKGDEVFLKFTSDSITCLNFEILKNYKKIDTVVSYKLKDGKIILANDSLNGFDIKIEKDSMILSTVVNEQKRNIIFKKLPEQPTRIEWNPTGKMYTDEFDGELRYVDFINDSILYMNDAYRDVNMFYWQVKHLDGYTFLVLQTPMDTTEVVLINAVQKDEVYATIYNENNDTIIFKKYDESTKKRSQLFGTWNLHYIEEIKKETDSFSVPISKNTLEKLEIRKDSITIFNKPFTYPSTWKYYQNRNQVLLFDEEKLIHIVKISKDSLVLEMNLSEYEQYNKRFVFTRE